MSNDIHIYQIELFKMSLRRSQEVRIRRLNEDNKTTVSVARLSDSYQEPGPFNLSYELGRLVQICRLLEISAAGTREEMVARIIADLMDVPSDIGSPSELSSTDGDYDDCMDLEFSS